MLMLHPPLKTNQEFILKVDPPHELYVEESGNPDGLPVIVLHGGPGGGSTPDMRRFFDPADYRITIFDHRGGYHSTPHGELEKNDTAALLADIEAIRQTLEIDKWIVFGGSWGSTLGLVYAEAFPERVLGLILRGIFLGRKRDIAYTYQEGANFLFPDHYQDFIKPLAANELDNVIDSYYGILTSEDELHRMAAAKAWSVWEARCATLHPDMKLIKNCSDPHFAFALARLECHYVRNACFLKPNQILDHIDRIREIPGIIVHGRYDVVCPMENAWLLHRAWPEAKLKIIRDAGHAASETGIIDALVHSTREMAKRFNR